MALDVVQVRSKQFRGASFNFAEVRGTPADHASWFSFDDEQELRDRWWHPTAGQTVLDIGAAFGSYVLPALALGARVIAFNPAPFDCELLEKNLELNPAWGKRCMVVREGLYSRAGHFDPDRCVFVDEGQTEGVASPEMMGMIGNRADGGAGFDKRQWLPARPLDSFLAERPGIGAISWIKIDVEGAELEVLKGAEKCLRMYRPRILVENHEFQHKGIENEVRDYLVGLNVGYVCDGPYAHCAVSHSFYEAK
jgi:FkbM family methyltransferase